MRVQMCIRDSSKAMKEVSQGDFEQHLETNSRIAEIGESYQSFNAVSYTHLDVYKRQVRSTCNIDSG